MQTTRAHRGTTILLNRATTKVAIAQKEKAIDEEV